MTADASLSKPESPSNPGPSHSDGTLLLSGGTAPEEVERRLNILSLLIDKAEAKVNHADSFRQRNMNYGFIVFAGLAALVLKSQGHGFRTLLASALLLFMLIFCFWDRRWHTTKHGWAAVSRSLRRKLVEVNNEPGKPIEISLYDPKQEATAEWLSVQPIVFYFLVLGSLLLFILTLAQHPLVSLPLP